MFSLICLCKCTDSKGWFTLGLNIGISRKELEHIAVSTGGDTRMAMLQMLITWRRNDPLNSWTKLKKVLNDHGLTQGLRAVISTGVCNTCNVFAPVHA